MPVDEYLRLKERLDQRPHTPALWESSKSDQSNIERDMDMATLDCSVAGFRQYSHVELFHHESSSSAKSQAVDSLEQWLNEKMYRKVMTSALTNACGTSTTPSFMEDYIVLSLGGDDSEIVIDDASYRESITGETTQEIDTLNEEAGNADDATPRTNSNFYGLLGARSSGSVHKVAKSKKYRKGSIPTERSGNPVC
ncbi:hypothetical protein MRX96_040407 [Rhipicephalus microplus]